MNAFLDFPLRFLLDKNTLFFFFKKKGKFGAYIKERSRVNRQWLSVASIIHRESAPLSLFLFSLPHPNSDV